MTGLLLPLLLTAGLTGFHHPPQETPQRSSALRIDLVAVDRKGIPVLDLKPEDIEIWIGHFRVPIESFTLASPTDEGGGRLIVLLLDDVMLSQTAVPRAREAARYFVNRMLPGDRMAIVTVGGTSMESTDDRARLFRALDAYNVRAAGVTRIDVFSEHVLETIASLSRQMTEATGRRKTIVAIGPGAIFDRPLPPPGVGADLVPRWIDAMRAMAFAHANLYVIDPGGVGSTRAYSGDTGFARASGGRAFLSTNDLKGAVDQILRDTSNYYVVAVPDPPVGRRADLRDLEVRVLRRGVTVLARRAIPGSLAPD